MAAPFSVLLPVQRSLAILCVCVLLVSSVPAQQKEQKEQPPVRIITTVNRVVVPVTITDKKGEFVTDLTRSDFAIFDNDQPQRMDAFELTTWPLSLVVVVDTSTRMAPLMPDLRKSGILLTQLVLGETGEAAVITYDQEVSIVQEFTANGDLVEKAIKNLHAGGAESHMHDAVFRAIGRLKMRPEERRKVIFLIGEGADRGSQNELGQALREAQLSGISIYCVELSTMKALAKQPPPDTTIDPLPPGARGPTPGRPPVPEAANSGSFLPLIIEAVRGIKKTIFSKPMKAYTEGTGSEHINTFTEHGFEQAIQRMGQDLHSQYLISYSPNNLRGSEFHNITVRLTRPGMKVRARPGYYYVSPEGIPAPADPKK